MTRTTLLESLEIGVERFLVGVQAYCRMQNQFHLLIEIHLGRRRGMLSASCRQATDQAGARHREEVGGRGIFILMGIPSLARAFEKARRKRVREPALQVAFTVHEVDLTALDEHRRNRTLQRRQR